MILTEEVYLTSNNYINKYYRSKGYDIPKLGEKFKVKVEDLQLNSAARISYLCSECGEITECSYYNYTHSKNHGVCQKCSVPRKYDINKIKKMFKSKGYILTSNFYKDRGASLLFICEKHSNIGEQETTLDAFLTGKKNCKECKREDIIDRKTPKSDDLIKICNDKGVIFVSYSHRKIRFICLKHKREGVQEGYLSNLKYTDVACHYCSKYKLSHEEFISCENINKYVTILEKYKGWNTKIKCKCKKCSHEWYVTPNKLMQGRGCPHCKMSKGELLIEDLLNKYSIKYETQYKFKDCKYKNLLLFDFYLPELNICIEFQGEQHYEPISLLGKTIEERDRKFKNIIIRDKIKRNYCKQNNIRLIEIPYYEKNVEIIIKNIY